jgi:nitric oxide reductase subunit B
MSVPAINLYTHGTHITVAHVMGTTIGINTMILLAVVTDVLDDTCHSLIKFKRPITNGLIVVNVALLVFLSSLVAAGIRRSQWQMSDQSIPFGEMMQQLSPYFIIFSVAGMIMLIGFCMIIHPLFRNVLMCQQKASMRISRGIVPKTVFLNQ